ncbi:MAG: HD domain-containing protein [Candidatus Pacearchaeota archaeon]|nr:HD domain-containing protein [Candidatus Pacearchaeota archaeon]
MVLPLIETDLIDYTLALKLKYPKKSRTKLVEILNSLNDSQFELIHKLEEHHPGSHRHSVNVAKVCIDFGIELGCQSYFENRGLYILGTAGLYHDVGKSEIPKEILTKPGKLTEEEFEEIKKHSRISYIEAKEANISEEVLRVMMLTHECKKDFTKNYPRSGLDRRKRQRKESKERREYDPRIIKMGQIVAISDMLVALREDRDYHKAMPKSKVQEILQATYSGNPEFIAKALERCIDWEYEATFGEQH